MSRPDLWSIDDLVRARLAGAHVWCLKRFAGVVGQTIDAPQVDELDDVPVEATTLIVVGGGTRIDEAKLWRRQHRRGLRLIVVPSVWGSGAEASPVVAVNRDGGKFIDVDESLVPDVRVLWPELARTLPLARARDGCGDVWTHALEAFLSPLGTSELRAEIASLIRQLLALPLGNDTRWFEVSARACEAQSKAGVGLVHGIAHVLEGPLTGQSLDRSFGHARLCSMFLRPVLALNREHSRKFDELTRAQDIDADAVVAVAANLYDAEAYDHVLPVLESYWQDVLRNPCSRTNSVLVRPGYLSFFTEGRFL